MKREFMLKVIDNDGVFNFESINTGFNALELIGILEAKKQDVERQIHCQTKYDRTYTEGDKKFKIEEVEE